MVDILSLEPSFAFQVQIFTRGSWKTKLVTHDLVVAEDKCDELAIKTLERCRVLRVDYSPIKIYCYAR